MAVAGHELAYITTADLATRIRRREISPVEAVDGYIQRIEDRNKSLNAFVYLGFDEARHRARESEQALVAGADLGILHGVPTAIKDLFDFKDGWPATFGGIRAFKDFRSNFYCMFAERVERAGAIILGKTNSPTMGFRGTCDNYLFGPTRNPFNLAKNTGGSSGGSAAAVADGLVPFAEGTDGGGSIRIPAAWCGLYGYKGSFGRVPFLAPNAFIGTSPFIFEGPLTRNVEDAALAMNALHGYDPRDPFALDEKVDFTAALRRSIKGMKIAYSPDWDVYPVDRRVAETVAKAVRAFEEAGAHVEEIKVGIKRPQKELSDLWCLLIMLANVSTFEGWKAAGTDALRDHRDDFPPEYLYWVERGYELKLTDWNRLQNMQTEIYHAVHGVLNNYDLLVTPTLACLQVDNTDDGNTKGPTEINGEEVDPLIGWCMTYLVNFSGNPAASIPAGMIDGLPVGMQIIGRRYADGDVFAASAAFERLRPWQHIYEIPANRTV